MQIAESLVRLKIFIVFILLTAEEAYFRNRYNGLFLNSGYSLLFHGGWIIFLFFLVGFDLFLDHLIFMWHNKTLTIKVKPILVILIILFVF